MPKRFQARFKDPVTGQWRTKRCATRAERDAIVTRMKALAWKVEAGLVDEAEVRAVQARRTPIEDTIEPWLEQLADAGTSAARRRDLELTIRRSLRDLGWTVVADADPNPLRVHLRGRPELSPRQVNRYLGAWKQWGRWASRRSVAILPRNPFEDVTLTTDPSRRREQRALTVAEVEALRDSKRWPDYLLMVRTGLRWAEARRLTWADVDLTERSIRVRQGFGKVQRQRATLLPVAWDLAALWEAEPAIGAKPLLRYAPPRSHQWPEELEAAGIERETAEGRATLGSFRATACTWWAAAGVELDTIRRLRRDFGLLVEQVYVQRREVLPGLIRAADRTADWHARQARGEAAEA